MLRAVFLGILVSLVPIASGQIVITEWMYSGADGEFIEFTNVGASAVDMTGWSFDDSSQIPGTVDLSAFGVVEPGESVVLTDAMAADFANAWNLFGVTVIGELSANLGRNDEINLYDASDNLIDRLTYGDEDYPDTPRTQYASCNIPDTDYGYATPQMTWELAAVGDAYGSTTSLSGDVASPGRIVGFALNDFDWDGDVDVADFELWVCTADGPLVAYDPFATVCGLTPDAEGFLVVDTDQDVDVDMADFANFQPCFSGEGVPADLSCGLPPEEPPAATYITLNGNSIAVDGTGVTVDGTTATITLQGTYDITGTLNDGQIVVTAPGSNSVELILRGVDITNSTSAPLNIVNAGYTSIVLADQTTNYLTDADSYVFPDPNTDEPSGALFSDDSLEITGTGALVIDANYNDGIVSKDDLLISGSPTITVMSVDDGIRGKDSLLIEGGTINVTSDDDAIKSDNEDDPELGYVTISGGSFNLTCGGDGITAETDLTITAGDFVITAGGGAGAYLPEDDSAKGLKGLVTLVVEGGTFDLNCADDGLHSNADITISGGDFTIATGDDGVHADELVTINGGTIEVTESYEGVEGADLIINDGTIRVTSSDDGINGAGGDGSGGWPPPPGDHSLTINGGYIAVYADGDGIDVNGDIVMTGGTVIVHGPTENFNGPLDYDGTFKISGGVLMAAGSSGMAQAPSTSSTQRSVKITYNSWKSAGTLAHIQKASGGTSLLTFAPSKMYRSLVFSSPDLVASTSYTLWRGGTCTGPETDGLYDGGTYSGGTQTSTFTTNNIVTNVNAP